MAQTEELSHEHVAQANPYGYFDKEHGEYVITRPDTPRHGSITWVKVCTVGLFPILPEDTLSIETRATGA